MFVSPEINLSLLIAGALAPDVRDMHSMCMPESDNSLIILVLANKYFNKSKIGKELFLFFLGHCAVQL